MNERRVLQILSRKGRGSRPRPGVIDLISKVCSTLRPRPFLLDNNPELGDFHNVLAPDSPSDPDNQGSKLFPTFREPIHGSFPSGLEHIPVAAGNNDAPVLEQ